MVESGHFARASVAAPLAGFLMVTLRSDAAMRHISGCDGLRFPDRTSALTGPVKRAAIGIRGRVKTPRDRSGGAIDHASLTERRAQRHAEAGMNGGELSSGIGAIG